MGGVLRLDAAIAGGGIIGLSLGLELRKRGLSVAILEKGPAMGEASRAAAGMLAVHDPQNPPALMPLAAYSRALYPEFLAHVEELSRRKVPLRTRKALQYVAATECAAHVLQTDLATLAPGLCAGEHIFQWLDEASLDPRDLCSALPLAFLAAGGLLLENTAVDMVESAATGVTVRTLLHTISAAMFVNCCGAWAAGVPVRPVKGQMLNLRCAPELLQCVVRAPEVYLVPRGDDRVTVGATIEEAGFDVSVDEKAIGTLARAALNLLPTASVPVPMDAWAGLRPGTPDGLPILGPAAQAQCWHATGHYRDGILLAPGTARLMAQRIAGEPTDITLEPYSSDRFGSARKEFSHGGSF